MEFAEKAQVIKMLARDLGQDAAPAIVALEERGIDAALGVLTRQTGTALGDAYLHQRALWRAGQSLS